MVNLLPDMLGVHDRDDAVQLELATNTLVDKKSLNHGRRIGQSGGFNHEGIELGPVFEKLKQAPQKVAAYGAADAAVAHLNDLLLRRDQ